MPRVEAGQIYELIKPIALSIDPKIFIEIMGSYRRGKTDCGDIDILISRDPSDGVTHAGKSLDCEDVCSGTEVSVRCSGAATTCM